MKKIFLSILMLSLMYNCDNNSVPSAEDISTFNKNVESFLPDEIFDAHAHWYHPSHLQNDIRSNNHKKVGYQTMKMGLDLWMGDREHDGLYFPFPVKWLNCDFANNFLAN